MLKINNLEVATDNKIILKDFNLIINDGEIHTIMGPNGVGKSTLSRVIWVILIIKFLMVKWLLMEII